MTNPSVWIVLAACAALLAGMLSWGVFGSVTTSVTATGAVVNEQAVCFLSAEDVTKVHVGDTANFGGTSMVVDEVATVPLSRDESRKELGSDYLSAALASSDWGYKVTFEGDTSALAHNVPQSVSATVQRIAPISLMLKGQG